VDQQSVNFYQPVANGSDLKKSAPPLTKIRSTLSLFSAAELTNAILDRSETSPDASICTLTDETQLRSIQELVENRTTATNHHRADQIISSMTTTTLHRDQPDALIPR
jgi:hypothetical protein